MTSPLASRQQIGYRQVLAVRQFAFLAVAHTVSLLGSTVATVALAVLAFQRTGSPLLSSLMFTVSFTPYLLGGLLASRLEHVPPRRLMVLCDVVQGISFLALAVPGLPVAGLLGLLAVGSVPAPVFSGTRAGLLPGLLGDGEGFVLGRSVLRLISQTSQILGLAVGGALLLLITPRAALLVVAATCAGSAVLIRAGLSSQHHAAPVQTLRPRLGLRPVFADPQRRALLVLGWLVPAAAVATEALAVPYVVSSVCPPPAPGSCSGRRPPAPSPASCSPSGSFPAPAASTACSRSSSWSWPYRSPSPCTPRCPLPRSCSCCPQPGSATPSAWTSNCSTPLRRSSTGAPSPCRPQA